MRSIINIAAFAAMSALLVAQPAAASDVEAQLLEMQERMEQMEQRLQATSDQLASAQETVAEQQTTIAGAGLELEDERTVRSGISDFIQQVDINSWLAVSYNYNFEGARDGNLNQGAQPNAYLATHPNHNTFQADQFWLELHKDPTEESRGGFHVDLVGGWNQDIPGYGVNVFAAYVSYLAPVLDGIQIDAGQLPTMQGAEAWQVNSRWNVTLGQVWNLQPTTNLGAVASTEIGGFGIALGILNEPIGNDLGNCGGACPGSDNNNGKALTSRFAFGTDKFDISAGVNFGPASQGGTASNNPGGTWNGTGNKSTLLFDTIFAADPLENLSAWINYDYLQIEDNNNSVDTTHGLAIAARLGVLDTTGVALRYEFVNINADTGGTNGATTNDTQIHTLTGTVDHALTDHLTTRLEVRWDRDDSSPFPKQDGGTTENSALFIAQFIYEF